jgi:hypothetical protein
VKELRFDKAPKLFGFIMNGFALFGVAFNDSDLIKFTHDNLWKYHVVSKKLHNFGICQHEVLKTNNN